MFGFGGTEFLILFPFLAIIAVFFVGLVYLVIFIRNKYPDIWWLALVLSLILGPAGQAYIPVWKVPFILSLVITMFISLGNPFSGMLTGGIVSVIIMSIRLAKLDAYPRKWSQSDNGFSFRNQDVDINSSSLNDKSFSTTQPRKHQDVNSSTQGSPDNNHKEDLNSNVWYVTIGGDNKTGPISLKKVYSMIQSGEIGGDHYVWSEGMKSWSKIKDMEIFKASTRSTPPPFPH